MKHASLFVLLVVVIAYPRTSSAQHAEVETETARPLGNGNFELGAAYEFQTSSVGTEHALPFSVEVGIGDRFEFLVEPVPFTAIRPSAAERAAGTVNATNMGDTEATLFGLVLHEHKWTPAVSLATEVKFPTAKNPSVGTGKTDLSFYVIGSKLIGRVDFHVNLGYSFIGQPAGVMANNIFDFAFAGIVPLGTRFEAFAEVYGNTSAAVNGEAGDAGGVVLSPELASGEVVGSVGGGWHINKIVMVSLGASYDSNHAFQLRPGITITDKAF